MLIAFRILHFYLNAEFISLYPVSYTHLDVYKRQPVSVTDGSAYGNPYNVTQTLQYNANFGLQLQIPLYNLSLIHI